jgi:hypothetical protein
VRTPRRGLGDSDYAVLGGAVGAGAPLLDQAHDRRGVDGDEVIPVILRHFAQTPVRRWQTVTLPNGVVVTYGYDPGFNVTSITYKTGGGAAIGTLTYGYDADGRRVSVGGSLAQTNLPLAQSFTYNPGQLAQHPGLAHGPKRR